MPVAPQTTPLTFRRVSRIGSVVGRVVPLSLVENPLVRSMAIDFVFGSLHVAFAVASIVAGLWLAITASARLRERQGRSLSVRLRHP